MTTPPIPPSPPTPPDEPPSPPRRYRRSVLPANAPVVVPEHEGPPLDLTPDLAANDVLKEQFIRDVVVHAERFSRAVTLAKPMESFPLSPIVLAVIALPCVALATYSLLARPDWVYGPDPARVAPARREASVRIAMFLVAQRLAAFQSANAGRLPRSLAEVGENPREMAYRIVNGSTFELHSSSPAVTLRSTDDLRKFLGRSRSVVREEQP